MTETDTHDQELVSVSLDLEERKEVTELLKRSIVTRFATPEVIGEIKHEDALDIVTDAVVTEGALLMRLSSPEAHGSMELAPAECALLERLLTYALGDLFAQSSQGHGPNPRFLSRVAMAAGTVTLKLRSAANSIENTGAISAL